MINYIITIILLISLYVSVFIAEIIECDEAFEKAQDMDTGWRGEDKE